MLSIVEISVSCREEPRTVYKLIYSDDSDLHVIYIFVYQIIFILYFIRNVMEGN
jgi:hypothetical protein